jgi:hypothetical protein
MSEPGFFVAVQHAECCDLPRPGVADLIGDEAEMKL